MTTKSQTIRDEQAEALAKLQDRLQPGTTVYTVLRHVSASGMSRSIQLLTVVDGTIVDISYMAARALDRKQDTSNGGIKCHGAGMDMGFELVYSLSRKLFAGTLDSADAGYLLTQRWL